MALMKGTFGTLFALVATIFVSAAIGMLVAISIVFAIAVVATIANLVEARVTGAPRRSLMTTEHTAFGTVLAVFATWILIGAYGPDGAGELRWSLVSALVIVATSHYATRGAAVRRANDALTGQE
jgi:hypothetical protein